MLCPICKKIRKSRFCTHTDYEIQIFENRQDMLNEIEEIARRIAREEIEDYMWDRDHPDY